MKAKTSGGNSKKQDNKSVAFGCAFALAFGRAEPIHRAKTSRDEWGTRPLTFPSALSAKVCAPTRLIRPTPRRSGRRAKRWLEKPSSRWNLCRVRALTTAPRKPGRCAPSSSCLPTKVHSCQRGNIDDFSQVKLYNHAGFDSRIRGARFFPYENWFVFFICVTVYSRLRAVNVRR